MKDVKVVLLDVDNTILDFDEYVKVAMKEGFEKFGIGQYEPYMYDIFTEENNKLWRRIEDGDLTFLELKKIRWNIIFDRLGFCYDGVTFEKYFGDCLFNSAIIVDGAKELLVALKKKYIVCVATNGPEAQQRNRLRLAGFDPYIDYYFISGQLGYSKPSSEFFDAAMTILNEGRDHPYEPADCLMIGDSLTSDIAGGRQYGMKTIFYDRTRGRKIAEEGPKADRSVYELREILEIL